jgi:capsular polysaccharide biosynthesis protein/Mrp family chromosome partitioning ATPase
MITWDELRPVLRAVLRWWWVCLLSVAISSGTAFYVSQGELRYYVTRTSLMVGNAIVMPRPDQNEISIGSSLARFYAELARRSMILQPVQERLQLPFRWELISDRMLTTNVIPSANLLEIYVTDSNPQRAAAIANTISEQLISYSPTSPDKIAAEQQAVDQQLKDSQKRLDDIKAKIEELTTRQKAATSASDLAEINETMVELNSSLEREQGTYSGLLGYKNSSVVNSLNVFEPAVPPTEPLPSKRKLTSGIAGLAGLLLSLVAIYILESLDTRWRRPREIQDRFKIGSLGSVPTGPPLLAAPETFVAERLRAVREVQTNILLAAGGVRTLLVSSPAGNEDRTSFSIDLADLFGRSGQRVLIVDADFINALLTKMLAPHGSPNNWTVISGDHQDNSWTVISGDHQDNIWTHLYQTPLTNVVLLPGQHDSIGAAALISSRRWRQLVERLLTTADIIIFDGPTALEGPDAALLAPHVDGVVLALDPTHDSRYHVAQSRERLLRQPGSNLLGAVTFTPSRHSRGGSLWRRLRGDRHPALPIAEPATNASSTPYSPNGQREPIVTPVPQDIIFDSVAMHQTPHTAGPIITPAPADAVAGEAEEDPPADHAPASSAVTGLGPEAHGATPAPELEQNNHSAHPGQSQR